MKRQCAALFLLGFFCALAQISFGIAGGGFGEGRESVNVAKNLAASGEVRDPFGIPTGPSAHVAPVYPALMAAVFKTWGASPSAVMPLLALNAILLGIGVGVLPSISAQIFGYPHAGLVGGILVCASWRMALDSEAALCAALAAVAAWAALRGWPWMAGLVGGLSVLSNPVALIALAIPALSRGWRFAAAVSALALALCAPWIARNWVVMGSPYFVRDNTGLELYVSNNDRAGPEAESNRGLWELHPMYNPSEAALVKAMGEGPYNRLRGATAAGWAKTHPERFLQLCAERLFLFWLPRLSANAQAYGYWIITILGAAGVWLARRNRVAMLLALAAAAYAAPFMFVQSDVRYRLPALWMSALLAGHAAMAALGKWRRIFPSAPNAVHD